jgi:hypothetical protein
MARQHVDYQTSALNPPNAPADDGLDTGSADAAAIRPVADGQAASAANLKRPSENLRTRTEKIRRELEDLKYLSDADRALLMTSAGSVTWHGQAPGVLPAGTFTLTPSEEITIRPFLSPLACSPSRLIICAGTVGQITIRTKRTGSVVPRAYSGANDITIDFQPVDTAGSGAVIVTATGSPANNVHVQYDSNAVGTTVTGFQSQFNASSVATTLGLEAVVETGGTPPEYGFPTPPASIGGTRLSDPVNGVQPSEMLTRYMSGAADAETHVITDTQISGFFADSLNLLQDGDTLCIRYEDLVMTPTDGGRRQSIIEAPEANLTIPSGSLFLLRRFPERLPLAIPICAVANNQLVFLNGRAFISGENGPLVSAGASYQGSNAPPNSWADGTIVSGPTPFEAALDDIIQTLGTKSGGTPGAIKIGFTPAGDIATNNVKAALEELDSKKASRAGPQNNAFTNTNTFTPSTAATNGITATGNTTGAGVNAIGGTAGGTGVIGRGYGSGSGGTFYADATASAGTAALNGISQATAGAKGVWGVGTGVYQGGYFTGGATGPSSFATTMDGAGVEARGGTAGNANGVYGKGGSAATPGARTEAFANNGVLGIGTGGGDGLVGVSSAAAATAGVHGYGSTGADTHGVWGTGNAAGVGVKGTTGTNGVGGDFTGNGTGVGVKVHSQDRWDLTNTDGDILLVGGGSDQYKFKIGMATGGGGAGAVGIGAFGGLDSLVLGAGATHPNTLSVSGGNVSVKTNYNYQTAKTFTLYVPISSMESYYDNSGFIYVVAVSDERWSNAGGALGELMGGAIAIPQGALITGFAVNLENTTAGPKTWAAGLIKKTATGTGFTTAGLMTGNVTSINQIVPATTQNWYSLGLVGGATAPIGDGALMGYVFHPGGTAQTQNFRGMRITYTIATVNPSI